VAAVFV
jgi:hypothetical protein